MTPAQQRTTFIGFGLLTLGVAVNALLLQPSPTERQAGRAIVDAVQTKQEIDRRQRLALDRVATPADAASAAGGAVAQFTAKPAASKSEALKIAQAPPRVTAGSPHPTAITTTEPNAGRFARLKPDAAHTDRAGDTLPDAPDAEGNPEIIRAVQRELTNRNYGPLVADGVPGLVTRAAIMAFEHDSRLPLTGEATEKLLSRLLLGFSGASDPADEASAGRVRSAAAEVVMRTVQQSLAALGYQAGRIDGRAGDDTDRAIREFESDQGLPLTGRISAEVFGRLGRVVASAKPQPIR